MASHNKILCLISILLFLPASCSWSIETSSLSGLGSSGKVHAELVMPDGKGPFPAVLILHSSRGIQKEDIDYAQRLADKGYACLVPYYFDTYHLSNETHNWATTVYAVEILDDFKSEINYLKGLPKIKKDHIGAVGFGMGGYWALVLAGMKKIQAGVSYYGTLKSGSIDSQVRYKFDDIFAKHSGPVLILHGEDDLSTSVDYVKQLKDTIKSKFSVCELEIYPNVSHYFDRGPLAQSHAASNSWEKTVAFLKKYLQLSQLD